MLTLVKKPAAKALRTIMCKLIDPDHPGSYQLEPLESRRANLLHRLLMPSRLGRMKIIEKMQDRGLTSVGFSLSSNDDSNWALARGLRFGGDKDFVYLFTDRGECPARKLYEYLISCGVERGR